MFYKCVDIKWKRQQSYFSEQETGMWENINCNNNKEWTHFTFIFNLTGSFHD